MSEERAERGAGAAARASERGAILDAGEEIAVDLAEPEPAQTPLAPAATEGVAPPDGRAKGSEGGGSRRPRNRMTLRIPDDEVVRPSSADSPPAPAVSETVPAARVVEAVAESPDSVPTPDTTPSPSTADLAPGAGEGGGQVPPDPPTVRLPSSPDTVADLGDLARTARVPAGETLRGLAAVTPAQAERLAILPDSPEALAASSMRLPAATLPYADPLRDDGAEARVRVEPASAPAIPVAPAVADSPAPPAASPPPPVAIARPDAATAPSKPAKPPELPPRAPRQSSIDIPVEEDLIEAPVSESAPPLDLDLERLSSRPSPAEPTAKNVQVPPSPPAPRVDLVAGVPQPASAPALPVAAVASAPTTPVAIPASGPASPGPMAVAAAVAPSSSASPQAPAAISGKGEHPAWLGAARPPAVALLAPEEEEEAAPVSSSRPSEPGEAHEVSPEDVVSVESVRDGGPGRGPPPAPALRGQAAVAAPAPAAKPVVVAVAPATPAVPPLPPTARPPLAVVPNAVGPSIGPSPLALNEGGAAVARRRVRPWWEELFNDDFIRTMAKITDEQIAAESDFIEDSLGVAKGAMVLDLACGTGRHAIELTRRGYQVVGFDLSLAMLARAADEAQDRNQKLNFVQGDMREMTFEDTFDGVYCWSTSFGFFEEEKNAQVVLNVRRALKKGGQFLLDVANRDFLARQAPSVAWFEGDGCVCMDEMNIDWITSRMRVKRTMMMDDGRTKETEYSIRVYSLHELGKLLHDSGFRVADVSGRTATPGVFLGADSPRTLILAEKR